MDFAEILVLLAITGGATKAAAYFAAEGKHLPLRERRSVAITSVTIQAAILSIFVAFGPNILKFFHVTIPALEVAGGLILLIFAIGLVLGEGHSDHDGKAPAGATMATYPLAVPLLASPQAIVAVTIIASTLGAGNRAPLWAAVGTLIVANFVAMLAVAQVIGGDKEAGSGGSGIAPILLRVVALLLAALAVEIIALGLRGYGVLGAMPGVAH
ncbi:MarC family protein [Sphingomonas hankookensis]